MAIGMVVGFGVALLLDRRLRKRGEERAARQREAHERSGLAAHPTAAQPTAANVEVSAVAGAVAVEDL